MSNAFFAFDGQQRMGASAVFAFALLSLTALTLVLLRVIWIGLVAIVKRTAAENLTREGLFFKSQLGAFAGCLLLANMLTAVSGVLEISWVALDGVEHGQVCSAQGVLSQIGQLATSYFVVVLGVHAFVTLALRNHHPSWFAITAIVFGWIASIVIAAAPSSVGSSTLGPLYGFVTIECDVTRAYPVAHVLIYFVPLFLSSFASTIIYSLIFLVLRGNVTINGGFKFHAHTKSSNWRSPDTGVEHYKRFVQAVARSMIWFPVAFMFCVVPNAIVQLVYTSGYPASTPGTAFTLVLRHLNGLLDVLILFNVLRVLGPVLESPGNSSIEKMLTRDGMPSGSSFGPGYGRSFMDDDQRSHQRAFAPIPPTSGRKPYQTHKHGRSGNSVANSTTNLISARGSMISYSEPGHSQRTPSDTGHGRLVTKDMISKPVPMDVDTMSVGIPDKTASQSRPVQFQKLTTESSQHRAIPTEPLSGFLRDAVLGESFTTTVMLQQASRKPLPLLPDPSQPKQSLVSVPNSSVVPRAALSHTLTFPEPSISSVPPRTSAQNLRQAQDVNRLHPINRSLHQEIVVQPVSPANLPRPPSERSEAVISLYMSSHRSVHEEQLPDFPTTASEYPAEARSPRLPAVEPRDYVQPAPPPRAIWRSPSPLTPRMRPTAASASAPSVTALSLVRTHPSSTAHEVPLATAVVTEFDVNEYMPSPAPPVPTLPADVKDPSHKYQQPITPARTVVDLTEYYEDEVPGLPPLPTFRPRLTVYDDELSMYSASATSWGFGTRPRESYSSIRALPLPPHMRLEVSVSPVALSVPSPKIERPMRGFRPIP